jgi:hypothetical protein
MQTTTLHRCDHSEQSVPPAPDSAWSYPTLCSYNTVVGYCSSGFMELDAAGFAVTTPSTSKLSLVMKRKVTPSSGSAHEKLCYQVCLRSFYGHRRPSK